MTKLILLLLLFFVDVRLSETIEIESTSQGTSTQSDRWSKLSIIYLSVIVVCSILLVGGIILTTVRGLREHHRQVSLNESISSDRDLSIQVTSIGPREWSDQDLAFITKNWNSFTYDERIRFCEVFYLKMDQDTAPLFLQLFLEAFSSELDRRVWFYLIDCFHLLYTMIFYNSELTEKLNKAVQIEADKILLNIGKDEMKGETSDSSFLRFACYDSMILLQNKKAIKKVLASFESTQFDYSTALRLAIWACTAREDKEPSDMRFILKEKLQCEKREDEKKIDHEETGTRRQHLIYAIGSTTDCGIYEYMYKKFVTEYQYSPSELVYLFKGACAFPDTRKRIVEAFWKDKMLKAKISKDKEAHEQIISILSRTSLVEKEIQDLEDYVSFSSDFGNSYRKKFNFEELISRANRYSMNSNVLQINLIKFLDGREKNDSPSPI